MLSPGVISHKLLTHKAFQGNIGRYYLNPVINEKKEKDEDH